MAAYVVSMADLAIVALRSRGSHGARLVDCGSLADTQSLVRREKNNWDLLVVFRRVARPGGYALVEVERYKGGRKYLVG